jgi:hypothetical protein
MPARPCSRLVSPAPVRPRSIARRLAVVLVAASAALSGTLSAGAAHASAASGSAAAKIQNRLGSVAAPVDVERGPGAAKRGSGGVTADEAARTPSQAAADRALAATQRVTLQAPAAARTGSSIRLTGTVSPVRTGLGVAVQRRYGGSWHTVARTKLTAKGSWSVTTRTPSARGWLSYRAVAARNGTLPKASTAARRVDNYTRHTYVVRKRGHITVSMKTFAAQAAQTYADARGWPAGHHRFARVAKGGDFTLVLAEAKYLPSYSSVCSVKYSCRAGRYVVINQNRWRRGSAPFTGSLRNYRHMVVNHETGHWLGRHHEFCGGDDELAPVMQQQSKGLQGCKPNAWPLAFEIRSVS